MAELGKKKRVAVMSRCCRHVLVQSELGDSGLPPPPPSPSLSLCVFFFFSPCCFSTSALDMPTPQTLNRVEV